MKCFNPRTHESATVKKAAELMKVKVSIHALMRVRPPYQLDGNAVRPVKVSIHALMRVRPSA